MCQSIIKEGEEACGGYIVDLERGATGRKSLDEWKMVLIARNFTMVTTFTDAAAFGLYKSSADRYLGHSPDYMACYKVFIQPYQIPMDVYYHRALLLHNEVISFSVMSYLIH